MLVLARKVGEQIVLYTSDGEVVIQLVEVHGRASARLGITAPVKVKIYRKEIAAPEQREAS